MKRLLHVKISYNTLLVLAIVALILVSVPLAYIGKYDVPSADDYSFSTDTYHALNNGTSLISAAADTVKRVYYSWQGTYSAVFFMSLQPSIFSFPSYSLTPVIMLFSISVGILYLIVSVFKYYGCTHRNKAIVCSIVVATVCIMFIPSPVQGLYWYNGSIYYTFFFALTLFEFAFFLRYLLNSNLYYIIMASVLAILIGGSNFSSALMCTVVCFGIILFGIFRKYKNWKMLLIPSALCMLGLIVSCIAPGNAVRQEEYLMHPTAVQAVFSSIISLPKLLCSWPCLVTIGMLIFLFPFFLDASREMKITVKYPLIYTVFSYLLLAVMICPTEYVFGSFGPPRLINTVFFAFVILSSLNELIWIRYFVQKKTDTDLNEIKVSANLSIIALVFLVFAGLTVVSVVYDGTSISSISAVSELRNGEAETYYNEACERQMIFESSKEKDVEIPSFTVKPYLLFFDDFSSDKTDWKNVDASTYFGLNSITCR